MSYGCAIEDVYKDWKQQQPQLPNSLQPQQPQQPQRPKQQQSDSKVSIKEICPECQKYINENNMLKQQIMSMTMWPRPRWVPQEQSTNYSFDPFNRYRENFTNIGSTDTYDIILYVLIALFILQLVECIYLRNCK